MGALPSTLLSMYCLHIIFIWGHFRYLRNLSAFAATCPDLVFCGFDGLAAARGEQPPPENHDHLAMVVPDSIDLLAELFSAGAARHALDHLFASDVGTFGTDAINILICVP